MLVNRRRQHLMEAAVRTPLGGKAFVVTHGFNRIDFFLSKLDHMKGINNGAILLQPIVSEVLQTANRDHRRNSGRHRSKCYVDE